MVEAVNGLIFNTLIAERAVNLPTIGTLYIERTAATTDGKRAIAPRYAVSFSSHLEAVSIVDVIARTASVDTATANDIFERWTAKVKDCNVLQISGVGVLKDKTFITDNELLNALNNNQITNLEITRKQGSAMRWIVVLVALVVVLVGSAYLYFSMQCEDEIVDVPCTVQEVVTEKVVVPEDNIEEEVIVIEEPEVIIEEPAVEVWTEAKDIRHRVIVGSYSTRENAERAIRDIKRRKPELTCSVYVLGSMYAVAIYGSADNADCEEFMREYKNDFAQMWIHTPKRYR
ncbi:MAG: SPOR domain-containing protein [Alistipes sp.]|nr:SPOR domain-containing protein [Alistipes sp.]